MRRVRRMAEPQEFDKEVRQPGIRCIKERTGQPVTGRRRLAQATTKDGQPITNPADLPSEEFKEYWTKILPQMRMLWSGICHYSAMYPEGACLTVDHFVAKTRDWKLAYEWDNYRLAASSVNSAKGNKVGIMDPFDVDDGWFVINAVSFEVEPGTAIPNREQAEYTIRELKLNSPGLVETRKAWVAAHLEAPMHAFFERRAPFLYSEMIRQGIIEPPP